MRIILLTQWFQPEAVFKGLPFARELVRLGHEVEVLTGFPNYPGGKVFDGYKIKFLQREVMDGINVIRVPLYPSHDSNAIRRIGNYASFALSAAILGPMLTKPADVMYVYHPPATIGLAAMSIKLFRGVPFIYDICDLWPDTLTTSGMVNSGAVMKSVDRWCKFVYSRADKITTLSHGLKGKLVDRGVPADKIEVVYNWCLEEQVYEGPKDEAIMAEYGLTGKFNIVYTGAMGKPQALDAVLDAAQIVRDQNPDIRFVFVGAGLDLDNLKNKTASMALPNVVFVPSQPVSEIGKYMHLADVLLVHLKRDPLFKVNIPSKTQAYMGAGRPILIGVEGDAAGLVEAANAGFACEPEDPRSIADAALRFASLPKAELDALGKRGREFYEKELSMTAGVRRFEAIMESLVAKRETADIRA